MKRKIADNWKFLVCVGLIGIVLLPMLCTIFYTLPSADDFSMVVDCSKSTLLRDSIRRANLTYMSWQGLWPYIFMETLINPLLLFSLESWGIGMEMILLFSAFIASLFALISTAAKKILGVNKKEIIAVYILFFLFVFINTNIYKEIFYWFIGSQYMMALTLGIITITLAIKYFYDDKRNRGAIFLSICGALACNFFHGAILPGMIYIVLWFCFSIKEHRPLWKKSIPFWIMLLSGLSAVAAPGNYVRHTAFDSSLNILKAVIDALKMTGIILNHLIQQPLVIVLLVFCIYTGMKHANRSVKGTYPLLAGFLFLLTLFLNAFPIALGYAGTSYFPNRIYFLLDFTALVGMIVFSICLGMYASGLEQYKALKMCYIETFLAFFIFLILYSTLIYTKNTRGLPWFQTLTSVKDVKELHDIWQDCLIEIRDSDESNVTIIVEQGSYVSPILSLPNLANNKENWVNESVAQFYGKESVVVIEQD